MKKRFHLYLIGLVVLSLGASSGASKAIASSTGAERFAVSAEGVIHDAETGFEWVLGPDRNTTYAQAEQWVAACSTAGGGWRMPTRKELRTIYQQGNGIRNLDPAFKTTGFHVWAEPRNQWSAWVFSFGMGNDVYFHRNQDNSCRVLGVRSPSNPNLKTSSSGEQPAVAGKQVDGSNTPAADLTAGAKRFAVSAQGVISDSETGLQWVVGPDKEMKYDQAGQWVKACSTAGGGWRMPTRKELRTLNQKDLGERPIDPAFKTSGWAVWAEPRDVSSAYFFMFSTTFPFGHHCAHDVGKRVFGVR